MSLTVILAPNRLTSSFRACEAAPELALLSRYYTVAAFRQNVNPIATVTAKERLECWLVWVRCHHRGSGT